ncbi:TPA: hypothetical protein KDX42_004134 [Vibrio parahaemolyticus]|nr:hypothetical protein [Vibrio parahaemolyticus]
MKNLIKHLFATFYISISEHFFHTTDRPVRGSLVYGDTLLGHLRHSGVYVGDNLIVHKTKQGRIEAVTKPQFLSELNGFSLYVSCDNQGIPVGDEACALRAQQAIRCVETYSHLTHNSHAFCGYCLTGVKAPHITLLSHLKIEASTYLNAHQWRVWRIK